MRWSVSAAGIDANGNGHRSCKRRVHLLLTKLDSSCITAFGIRGGRSGRHVHLCFMALLQRSGSNAGAVAAGASLRAARRVVNTRSFGDRLLSKKLRGIPLAPVIIHQLSVAAGRQRRGLLHNLLLCGGGMQIHRRVVRDVRRFKRRFRFLKASSCSGSLGHRLLWWLGRRITGDVRPQESLK